MLDDHEHAEAYAFLMDAIEDVNTFLNIVETELLDEDWVIVKEMGRKLTKAREILEL